MNLKSAVSLFCAFLIGTTSVATISFSIPALGATPIPVAARNDSSFGPTADERSFALRQEIHEIFQKRGTQALTQFLRDKAEAGLDLQPLREYFLKKNNGKIEFIDELIPEGGESFINFANAQLRLSGVDFIQFRGIVDKNLRLDARSPAHQKLYQRWQKIRTFTIPYLGFGVALIQMSLGMIPSHAQLAASLAGAVCILGLETQFAKFSSWWNRHFWSKDKPFIRLSWRVTGEQRTLSKAAKLLNRLLDSTQRVTQAHAWIYLVNWIYALILSAASTVTLQVYGAAAPHFLAHFLNFLSNTFKTGSASFFSFALFQVLLGKAFARGEIAELLRYQLECLAVDWGTIWRDVAATGGRQHPGRTKFGNLMLYSFAAFATAPLLLKTAMSGLYAKKTARIFTLNGEHARNYSYSCMQLLAAKAKKTPSDFYMIIPFSKQKSVGALIKRLGRSP